MKSDLRAARPNRVVAVPIGCRAYCTLRMSFGVTRRLIDPVVLLPTKDRTDCRSCVVIQAAADGLVLLVTLLDGRRLPMSSRVSLRIVDG